MTVQDIISALDELKPQELAIVDAKLHELMKQSQERPPVWDSLLKLAGTVETLPPDFAEQHDHYLHGIPKR